METADDPYVVLGVRRDATDDELRQAYESRLAGAAAAGAWKTAQRVDAAFSVLRDPYRRNAFDRDGTIIDRPRLVPAQRSTATSEPVPHRGADPRRRRSGRSHVRAERVRSAVVLVVVVALLAGGVKVGLLRHVAGGGVLSDGWRSAPVATSGFPVKYSSHRSRVLPAAVANSTSTAFDFEMPGAAGPVRWDPCAPIRYVVSGTAPFAGADQLLTSAIDEISAASGLQFVNAGTTTELPSDTRSAYQPDRYGQRWAPVLVAWTDPSVAPKLSGDVVGFGGGAQATLVGQPRVVSGIVAFDGPDLVRGLRRPDGRLTAREVMLHEFGHLVGLAHVHDDHEVMNPTALPLAHFGEGDRQGLAVLGDGRCPAAY